MELNNKIKEITGRFLKVYKNKMFVKSFVVGCIGVSVDLSLLFVLTDISRLNYWISANIAFVITALINFSLQKFWTFGDAGVAKTGFQVIKFFLLALLNLFANSILMYIFVGIFGIWYLLAQAVITASLFLFNFAVYRFYIFI
jgi:putative flippase GtrA